MNIFEEQVVLTHGPKWQLRSEIHIITGLKKDMYLQHVMMSMNIPAKLIGQKEEKILRIKVLEVESRCFYGCSRWIMVGEGGYWGD